MAKKASKNGRVEGESIQGYFRTIFKEKPKLIKSRSNQELFDRWLTDHPGATDVPQSVKNGLFNLKSVLRSKKRKKKTKQPLEVPVALAVVATPEENELEVLEERIDDCLSMARAMNRRDLENAIHLLRKARNAVVWQLEE